MGSFYSDHRTWLHAVSASLKLILLAIFGTAVFVFDNTMVLLASSALCLLLFASLGRATLPARKLLIMVFLTGLLITAFHAYMAQPLLGVVSALRLLSASLLGIAQMLTTRAKRTRAARADPPGAAVVPFALFGEPLLKQRAQLVEIDGLEQLRLFRREPELVPGIREPV